MKFEFMKRIYYFLLVAAGLLFDISIYAQDFGAWAGSKGIFIKFGKVLPVNFEYVLERKISGENQWTAVGSFRIPASKPEMLSRIRLAVAKNPIFSMPDNHSVSFFWNKLSKSLVCDSLYFYAAGIIYLEASGVAYFDNNIKPSVGYTYRISRLQKGKPMGTPVEAQTLSFPGEKPVYSERFISATANGNSVMLSYSIPASKHPYGIRLLRQYYLQTPLEQITADIVFVSKNDSITAEITDNSVGERMTYRYVVEMFDYLGNMALPAEAVTVVNIKPYGESVILKKFIATSVESSGSVQLNWWYNGQRPALNNIQVFRSDSFDCGFKRIALLPANDTSFTDNGVVPIHSYYYYLVFNNVYGQSPPTNKVVGMLKPVKSGLLPPMHVRIASVFDGNRISWVRAGENIKGYYVYRADGYTGELKQYSPFIGSDSSANVYVDKSENLLPGKIYSYAVVAVNTSSYLSSFSERVASKPLPAKLETPLNLRAIKQGKNVLLVWENMSETDENINSYKIFRAIALLNSDSYGKFLPVASSSVNNYTDTTVADGYKYAYSICSVGISGSESPKSTVVLITVNINQPLPPAGLRVITSAKEILIHWDRVASNDIKEYRLYREIPGEKAALISAFKPDNTDFTDATLKKGQTAYYSVTTVNSKGEESEKSDEVGAVQ
jgi:fibronectin type 3 domain-containing protein